MKREETEMRYRTTIWVASALLLASVPRGWAQGVAGTIVGFLNYPVAPEMAARGDAGVSVVTNNAMSVIANPAQLGNVEHDQ